jgi:hypothetical protein
MEVSFIGGGNHQPAVKKRMNYLTLPKKQQTMKKKYTELNIQWNQYI